MRKANPGHPRNRLMACSERSYEKRPGKTTWGNVGMGRTCRAVAGNRSGHGRNMIGGGKIVCA